MKVIWTGSQEKTMIMKRRQEVHIGVVAQSMAGEGDHAPKIALATLTIRNLKNIPIQRVMVA